MIKKYLTLFITLNILLIPTLAYGKSGFKKYCNARFVYCIDYPEFMVPQGESENGDGQKFLSSDKQSELIVWGSLNINNLTTGDAYKEYMAGKTVKYKVIKSNA